jgi:hypothetical protein
MAKEAVTKALKDAGLQISDIKQACVGYVYGMYFLCIIIILVFLYFPNGTRTSAKHLWLIQLDS